MKIKNLVTLLFVLISLVIASFVIINIKNGLNAGNAEAQPIGGISLECYDREKSVKPGGEADYEVIVYNNASFGQEVTLTHNYGGKEWNVSIQPSVLEVGANLWNYTHVYVKAPEDAKPDDYLNIAITATGEKANYSLWLNTTVVPFEYGVTVTARSNQKEGKPGDKVNFTFSVKNTGDLKDTYNLFVTCVWNYHISQNQITLDSGKSKDVSVAVDVPLNATNGTLHLVVLTAQSLNSSKEDTAKSQIRVVYVAPRNILYVGGTGPNNYTSIQSAINAANNGDTIFVYNGTYYENIVVNKSVHLIGENKETTIVNGNYNGDVVYVTADNVTISEFTITHGGGWHAGVNIYFSTNCSIYNDDISNNWYGVELVISTNCSISNSIISNNDNEGMWLYNTNNCIITANTMINDNIFIYGYFATYNIDTSNTVNGKPVYYIKNANNIVVPPNAGEVIIANCNNITIKNENLSNADIGIEIANSTNCSISNNIISNNNGDGIQLYSSPQCSISNSTISNNNYHGIYAYSSGNCNIYNNNVKNNHGWGIWLKYCSNCRIYMDNFIHDGAYPCSSYNIIWHSPVPINYTYNGNNYTNYLGNYWGGYTGIDTNGDGIGDTPYHVGGSDYDYYPLMQPYENYTVLYKEKPPICSLSVNPSSGYAPLTVTFTIEAYDEDGYIVSWKLDCNGDGIYDYNGSGNPPYSVNFTYTYTGNYTAKFVVTDNNGSETISTFPIEVKPLPNQPPSCSLHASPSSGYAPLTVTFSLSASDSDGWIKSWSLDVDNDGSAEFSGSGDPPSMENYTYSSAGTYTANLTVVDNNDSRTFSLIVVKVYQHENKKYVTVAPWNLQVFGVTKASNETLLNYYAGKIDDYDVCVVQEIRDKSGTAIQKLAAKLPGYHYIISQRAGTTSSKEQYAIFYDGEVTLLSQHDYTPEKQDEFERPPFEAEFRAGNWTFTLYTIHTKLSNVYEELTNLENLVDDPEGDTIILGDLNADGSYYDEDNIQHFTNWDWVITNDMDTTVAASSNTYDRIIINSAAENNFVRAGVMNDVTKDESDHYLVYAVFDCSHA